MEKNTVRIGMVSYINAAPICLPFQRLAREQTWSIVEAPPARLNQMLSAGELDIAFVSSFAYCQQPEQFRILDGLSISSSGKVGSVFLFARHELAKLAAAPLLLTNQSATSVALVKILLEEIAGVFPKYSSGAITTHNLDDYQAVLAIGDEALRLAISRQFPLCYDLGELWQKNTGLPFVFAVFAVRESFCRQQPQLVETVRQGLLVSQKEGEQNLAELSRNIAPRIPMSAADCHRYLQGIEYDLGEAKQQGLSHFARILIARGEANEKCLPLRIVPQPKR